MEGKKGHVGPEDANGEHLVDEVIPGAGSSVDQLLQHTKAADLNPADVAASR